MQYFVFMREIQNAAFLWNRKMQEGSYAFGQIFKGFPSDQKTAGSK